MTEQTTIVIGLGATGYSCIRHLAGRDRLLAMDTRAVPPYLATVRADYPEVEILTPGAWRSALARADRVVVSPGIALDHCLVAEARAAGVALSSDIELFLQAARAPVIGVTGTNGKSTVTTLVGKLMAAGGGDVGVGGNLGMPALDLLADRRHAYVLELSSFQLERLKRPGLAVAAVLNVSPDHLDRYRDIDAYAASKRRIYAGAGAAVCNADDPRSKPRAADGESRVPPTIAVNGDPRWRMDGGELIIDGHRLAAASLGLRGSHNHFNALAAAAIVHQAGADIGTRLNVLRDFRGLPHRSALVARIDGVAYVNDSKATNVGACLTALNSFGNGTANIVLIAGGDAKGVNFEVLTDAIARHVSRLVLIGRDGARIAQAVGDAVETVYAGNMLEAIRLARAVARSGDTVLLSPACASFDMYTDFRARGASFIAAVHALAGSAESVP